MPEDEEHTGKTIAEAFAELTGRVDRVEEEHGRLRDELTAARSNDGREQPASDRADEDTSESSATEDISEASQEASEEVGADVGHVESDTAPRPTHRWWRNPIGGS